jgi:membrane fusion protein, multidrug efflux system
MKKITGVILPIILLAGCSEDEAKQPAVRPVISMVVESVEKSAAGSPGVVAARVSSDLGFRVLGNLITRPVDVGDHVKKGEIIATLESSSQTLAVSAAEADVRNTQAKRENAALSLARKQTLADAGLAPQAAFEQAQQAMRSAEAGVNRANAILDKAREQLDYTVLRSQFDGIVTKVLVEVGQTVDAGTPIVTIAQPDEREVVIDVPDYLFSRLEPGTPFEVSLQLDRNSTAKGVVRELAPAADPLTRTRRVRISLESPPDVFRIGAVVTAVFRQQDQKGFSIPRRAIGTQDGTFVWIVDEQAGTVKRRSIEIDQATISSEFVVVRSGISAGERVVLAGVLELSEGQAIRIPRRDTL